MNKHIYFGEVVEGYETRVLNEREARAGAGILFLFALISFMYSYIFHDFRYTQIFITFFMVDFFLRIYINPKYAPSLILGRFFVSHQKPEYVGASQKRFAWHIGFTLAVIMFLLVVVFELMTPIKIVICILCLILLFFEAVFGICLGCVLYNKFSKNKVQYCPGEVCESRQKEEIQKINLLQMTIALSAFMIAGVLTYHTIITPFNQSKTHHHMSTTNSEHKE
ncbi:DUF4395 domain-containing protein [Candidatus Marithrix sp. Canyon 246]|uniref:DUF4395 domain-containing protein n=1 Tax=Candidatus Marithrix sp. Canyon 246 TaxID=1827136 RepID=UPI00084A26A5|nr:DUF4395 domain-containing protein [Candidatus Marithrix sp. Canyon 246]